MYPVNEKFTLLPICFPIQNEKRLKMGSFFPSACKIAHFRIPETGFQTKVE